MIGGKKVNHSHQAKSLRKDRRAVSPALSSIILTCAVIIMVLTAMFFANNFIQTTLSQNEYKANKQFMITEGLQIDDVAWTTGRTQTSIFASKYGTVSFEPTVMTYTFEVRSSSGVWTTIGNWSTGIVMFNMPTNIFNLGDGYFESIFPTNASFLQPSSSAPVSQVFVSQKNSIQRGSDLRVVAVPTIRLLSSNITTLSQRQNYLKLYLPVLSSGSNHYLSQSVTQAGISVFKTAQTDVTQIRVSASVPASAQSLGYDLGDQNSQSFFRFQTTVATYPSSPLTTPSILELYVANVSVSIGLAT
jgi:hypothetical protein